ncbi:diguanylate cyclase [Guyparkeria hydrothermalis]|uniref:diguanylate cyclase domain-containing protein n=1 Tax=Guyparkeria hydrothermalis TaxID=923 RepID=UPI0020205681|nr:diguanylate cyclase [Guyparkeria hydrothermalis]MCL7744104.1 diguanylate cyclase [Guyparkeria hydrothermalis]
MGQKSIVRRNTRHLITLVLGVVGYGLLVWSYWQGYQELENTTTQRALGHLHAEYDAWADWQGLLADQVYEDRLQRPDVTAIMAEATKASAPERRAVLRDRLFASLEDLYPRLKDKGVRQFHFHLPGAVSFLRFHRPERFGDSLWDVRASLRFVNEQKTPIAGFEEGRLFNGFRHVYPLFHRGEFVGSVEVSFSFRAVLLHHSELDHGLYRLLVDRDLVRKKGWEGAISRNYLAANLNPKFHVDRYADLVANPGLTPPGYGWLLESLPDFDESLRTRVAAQMAEWDAFAVTLHQRRPLVVAFLPIQTIAGDWGAYIVRYEEAPAMGREWQYLWFKILFTGLLLLVAIVLVVNLDRRETRRAREREALLVSLHEREQSLSEAQRLANVGNWECLLPSMEVRWSDEIFRIFGYEPGEVEPTYKLFLDAVHPADRERIQAAVEQAMREGTAYNVEHRIYRKDGKLRFIQSRGRAEPREAPRRLYGTVQDVTARRRADEERRQAAAIIESTHEGIMVTDEDGLILRVNPAFTELMGYSPDEVIGRPAVNLCVDQPGEPRCEEAWKELEREGAWEGETWQKRRDGERIPMRLSLTSLTSEWGATRYVGMMTDITLFKEREAAMWKRAHHDALTGLSNRVLLQERMSRAIKEARRHGDLLGLLYIDLDDFKPVNDVWGHDAGDHLLCEVANRMQSIMRETDTVSRLGGDEFAVLIARPTSRSDLDAVVDKLRVELDRPVVWRGHELRIKPSIGMAIYPDDGEAAEVLLKAADRAMYEEKRRRKEANAARKLHDQGV